MKIIRNPGLRFGHTIYAHNKVDSTQNRAFELARQGAEQGTVVIAQIQEKGRGRQDKHWISEKGGLYFSIVYKPKKTLMEVISLTKTIGLCVKKAIEKNITFFLPLKLTIRGINDIMLNNRKLCGILVETETIGSGDTSVSPNFYIIGIGVNVNQKHFPRHYESTATSLMSETNRKFSRYRILKSICEILSCSLPD